MKYEYAANKRKQLDDLLLQKGKQFPINKDCAFYGPEENNCTILKMDYCCYERKCNFFKVKHGERLKDPVAKKYIPAFKPEEEKEEESC